MYIGFFTMPEWQGKKESSVRPCVVRRKNKEKAEVIPCTSNRSNREWTNGLYISSAGVTGYAVMEARKVVDLKDVRILDVLDQKWEDELILWESVHNLPLNKSEVSRCKELCPNSYYMN